MITVRSDRDAALPIALDVLRERVPDLTLEQIRQAFASFDLMTLCDGGRPVGMLMIRGPEVHVAVVAACRRRWLSRRLIREVFAPILRRWGHARTAVMRENEIGRRFVERLGFKQEAEHGDVCYYRLEAHANPYTRSH